MDIAFQAEMTQAVELMVYVFTMFGIVLSMIVGVRA